MSELSIVTCTIDNDRYERFAHKIAKHFSAVPTTLIKVFNPPSLAAGYNMGLARVATRHVIFCHDDIDVVSPGFALRLVKHLEHWDVIGVAGASRLKSGLWTAAGESCVHGQVIQHRGGGNCTLDVFDPGQSGATVAPAMVLDGLFCACRTDVARKIGFDESTFRSFHFYDIDFTLRCSLAGRRVGIARDLLLYHDSPGRFDEVWYYYCGRFEERYKDLLYQGQVDEAKVVKRPLANNENVAELFRQMREISW